ncbi:MAG TPA: rhomboid family intramembrane serine protease, partial [Thermoanaerobaculia bacterium]
MFRSRGENLRSVFVLLFLYIAFYFLEHQDPKKFAQLFAFDADGVLRGELWRLVTYQFTQAGHGVFHFPRPIALFFTLLLLHILGSSTEDQLGTRHFLGLFAISTVTSAGVAALLDIPLFGSYFVSPSL